MNSNDWDEAWKRALEEPHDASEHVLVFALVELIVAQVEQSPLNRRQALAALAIAKVVLEMR